MKTLRFICAATLAAIMSFSITSCGTKDDDEGIVLDPTIKKTVVDEVIEMPITNINEDERTVELAKITPIKEDCPIDKFVLLYDNNAFLFPKSGTRAFNSGVISCTYTVQGKNIIIETGKSYGKVTIKLDAITQVYMNGETYEASKEDIPALTSVSEKNLCRTWKNAKYSAGIYFDKLPVYGAIESEKGEVDDVRILKNAIMQKLIKEEKLKDEGFKFLNNSIKAVNFLADGYLYITYADDTVEESKWTWKDQSAAKLNTYIDGVNVDVDVRYKTGTPNEVYFVIDANLKGVGGLGQHTLSGRLICHMTE